MMIGGRSAHASSAAVVSGVSATSRCSGCSTKIEPAQKARDHRVAEQLLPQRAERRDLAIVLIPIEREGAARRHAIEQPRQRAAAARGRARCSPPSLILKCVSP